MTGSGGSGHAVQVTIDRNQEINRLWGIPLFGLMVRWILLIPHFLILWILGVVGALATLVTWIPVLLLGRFPSWAFDLYVMTYRWGVRVAAYAVLMAGPYPPFSSEGSYPVDLTVVRSSSINRAWGFPFLGLWVRGLLVIPHFIILVVLSIGIAFAMLVTWIPVLLNGRFPQLGYDLVGGYLRLTARASLWALLVPMSYPPILPAE